MAFGNGQMLACMLVLGLCTTVGARPAPTGHELQASGRRLKQATRANISAAAGSSSSIASLLGGGTGGRTRRPTRPRTTAAATPTRPKSTHKPSVAKTSRPKHVKLSARPPPPARTDATTNEAKVYIVTSSKPVYDTYSDGGSARVPASAMNVVTGIIQTCGGELQDHINGQNNYPQGVTTDLQAAQVCVNKLCTSNSSRQQICQTSGLIAASTSG